LTNLIPGAFFLGGLGGGVDSQLDGLEGFLAESAFDFPPQTPAVFQFGQGQLDASVPAVVANAEDSKAQFAQPYFRTLDAREPFRRHRGTDRDARGKTSRCGFVGDQESLLARVASNVLLVQA
jgi:hypothetical protein